VTGIAVGIAIALACAVLIFWKLRRDAKKQAHEWRTLAINSESLLQETAALIASYQNAISTLVDARNKAAAAGTGTDPKEWRQ
jgi:uncharacterized protein HemX